MRRHTTSIIPLPDSETTKLASTSWNSSILRLPLGDVPISITREVSDHRGDFCHSREGWHRQPISGVAGKDESFTLNKEKPANDFAFSTGRRDSPSPHNPLYSYELVLYKDQNLVVWNPQTRLIGARNLTNYEQTALLAQRLAKCPLCHQDLDPARFSFEAQSYFRILEDAMREFNRTRHRQYRTWRAERSPNMSFKDHVYPLPSGDTLPASSPTRTRAQSQVPDSSPDTGTLLQSWSHPARSSRVSESGPSFEACHGLFEDHPELNLKSIPSHLLVAHYYERFFEEVEKIGSGSFGQVFKCAHKLDDINLGVYAVKKIPVGDNKEWLGKMLKEVKIRERLQHPNIVDYKHSWLEMSRASEFCPMIPYLFVLMEYANAGDLDNLLCDASGGPRRFTEPQIWCILLDVIYGLHHLHRAGILHRDLKPQNILLNCDVDHSDGLPSTRAMLADFGTAELLSEGSGNTAHSGFTGTMEFTAPELLDGSGTVPNLDFKSDMWSLGVLLHLLAFNEIPFADSIQEQSDPEVIRAQVLRFAECRRDVARSRAFEVDAGDDFQEITDLPFRIPGTGRDRQDSAPRSWGINAIISSLMAVDPRDRPSTDAVLNSPILAIVMSKKQELRAASMELAQLLGGTI